MMEPPPLPLDLGQRPSPAVMLYLGDLPLLHDPDRFRRLLED